MRPIPVPTVVSLSPSLTSEIDTRTHMQEGYFAAPSVASLLPSLAILRNTKVSIQKTTPLNVPSVESLSPSPVI